MVKILQNFNHKMVKYSKVQNVRQMLHKRQLFEAHVKILRLALNCRSVTTEM